MNKKNGFVAISIVLILVSVVAVIITTVTLLSINEAQSSLALEQGESSLAFVEGCTEDILLQVHNNPNFNKSVITHPDGICNISYVSQNPSWDIVISQGGNPKYQRKIEVKFSRNGNGITLTSWQEI